MKTNLKFLVMFMIYTIFILNVVGMISQTIIIILMIGNEYDKVMGGCGSWSGMEISTMKILYNNNVRLEINGFDNNG
jgi:hypothetical protein